MGKPRSQLQRAGAAIAEAIEHPVLEGVKERVAYIEQLMVHGDWVVGETWSVLAEVWGVEGSTVRGYSAEAWRNVQPRDDSLERAQLGWQMVNRVQKFVRAKELSKVPGDAGAAVRGYELLLKVSGMLDPPESKPEPATAVVIGQIITSPAMQMLVGATVNVQSPAASPSTEAAEELPAADCGSPMVPRRDQRT